MQKRVWKSSVADPDPVPGSGVLIIYCKPKNIYLGQNAQTLWRRSGIRDGKNSDPGQK